MNVATFHEVDQNSGMIQSTGNYAYAFDVGKKELFLDLYKKNGLAFYRTCKELSLCYSTVNHHYDIDPQFKLAMDQCEKEYADELQAVSRKNALEPKMVIERIFQLKSLLPEKYTDAQKQQSGQIVIHVQGDLVVDAKRRIESLKQQIDQEVVDTSAKIVENAQNNAPNVDHVI